MLSILNKKREIEEAFENKNYNLVKQKLKSFSIKNEFFIQPARITIIVLEK